MFDLILQGIIPVIFVIALGFYSGRRKIVSQEGARSLSTFVVQFAYPCTLFVATFGFTSKQLENGPYIAMLILSIMIPFAIAVVVGKRIFKQSLDEAGLFACNCGFPSTAVFGLPILKSVFGAVGLLPVIVGSLVTSVLMMPVIIFLVHHGTPVATGQKQETFAANMLNTIKQPVVWGPILGLVLVSAGFRLPLLAKLPLQELGDATGGAALFTIGVLLSALKPRFEWSTAVVLLFKNMLMPALALGLGLLFHVDSILVKGAVIATASPSASLGAILSSTFMIGQKSIPPQILASDLFGVFSMAFWIYVVEQI